VTVRRVAAVVLWVVGGLGAIAGVALLIWAGNRKYADNQRNWGYMLGFLGVVGGVALAAIGAAVRGKRSTNHSRA
jgi:hypothetical protein